MRKNLFLFALIFIFGLASCSKKSADETPQSSLKGLVKTEKVSTDWYSQTTTLEYNSKRQLVKMTTGNTVLEYHYLNDGLIINPYGDSLFLNGNGFLEKIVYSTSKKITYYEYDSEGLCIKIWGKDNSLPDSCMTETTPIFMNGNLMSSQYFVHCSGIIFNSAYTYTDTLNISQEDGSGQPYLGRGNKNLMRELVTSGPGNIVDHWRYTYELYPDGYVKKKVTDYNGKITVREYTYFE